MNTKIIKAILTMLAISLVLLGAGCADKENRSTDRNVSAVTDPVETQLEAEVIEPVSINSTVNLSQGEMLKTSGRASVSPNGIVTVEIYATNNGDKDVNIAYLASFFDNQKDPIMQAWDDGDRVINPGEKEAFYLSSDEGSQDFFSKTNGQVVFRFSLSTDDGETQTIIYKGKTTIPFLEAEKPVALEIEKMEE